MKNKRLCLTFSKILKFWLLRIVNPVALLKTHLLTSPFKINWNFFRNAWDALSSDQKPLGIGIVASRLRKSRNLSSGQIFGSQPRHFGNFSDRKFRCVVANRPKLSTQAPNLHLLLGPSQKTSLKKFALFQFRAKVVRSKNGTEIFEQTWTRVFHFESELPTLKPITFTFNKLL